MAQGTWKMPQWLIDLIERYKKPEDPPIDPPIDPPVENKPERSVRVETGRSTSEHGCQWIKIPAPYRCGLVTVDSTTAVSKVKQGMLLWYIKISKITKGHLRIDCKDVVYTATIAKHGGGSGGGTGGGGGGTASNREFHHHYNPAAWHGRGSAIVCCPGAPKMDSVTIGGRSLRKHGSLDKGREVWTDYHKKGLSGEIVMRSGSRTWRFNVRGHGMQYGDC